MTIEKIAALSLAALTRKTTRGRANAGVMYWLRIAFATLTAVFVAGCAPAPVSIDEKPRDYSGPVGYVVGSLVKDKRGIDPSPDGGSGALYFSSLDDSWEFSVAIIAEPGPLGSDWDFIEEEHRGLVFLVPVEPGTYEIDGTGGHFAFTSYATREPFSLPFVVEEGKATYIGEFTFRYKLGSEFIGPFFSVSSNETRDYQLLTTKYPEFDAATAKVSLPDRSILFSVILEVDMEELRDLAKAARE